MKTKKLKVTWDVDSKSYIFYYKGIAIGLKSKTLAEAQEEAKGFVA